MILTPHQWKLLRDTYALAHFLEADQNMQSVAERLRETIGEALDLAQRLTKEQEIEAPF
jgi:hypothetical protein